MKHGSVLVGHESCDPPHSQAAKATMDHVEHTIETYDRIAADYHVIATRAHRAWLEDSMRLFFRRLPGRSVLVAGCGEGRDSRYLRELGAEVLSFDLSEGMLALARAADPDGVYVRADLRQVETLGGEYDGIWACACLYHLTKAEFRACLAKLHRLLRGRGVLFLNLKLGTGERTIEVPRDGYPGGTAAKTQLAGQRFYAFYQRDELREYFAGFTVEKERRDLLKEGEGAMEFWLRKPADQAGARGDNSIELSDLHAHKPASPPAPMAATITTDEPVSFHPIHPDDPAVAPLIAELSSTLTQITGSSGQTSFSNADMSDARALFLLGTAGGRPIACGGLRRIDERTCELKRMYTREPRRGVGSLLLVRLEHEAWRLGYERIRLETRKVNQRAVNFYLKHGYAVIPNYGKYAGNEAAVCFEKLLPSKPTSSQSSAGGGR